MALRSHHGSTLEPKNSMRLVIGDESCPVLAGGAGCSNAKAFLSALPPPSSSSCCSWRLTSSGEGLAFSPLLPCQIRSSGFFASVRPGSCNGRSFARLGRRQFHISDSLDPLFSTFSLVNLARI
jgi:hypothetical protein